MKLSKRSEALQRAIHKAVASGKALGGLLVGLAATVTGCREHTPANTMGSYPASPQQQEQPQTASSGAQIQKSLPAQGTASAQTIQVPNEEKAR